MYVHVRLIILLISETSLYLSSSAGFCIILIRQDESEDEADGEDGGTRKKKRRWRKNEPPKQHWVLMENDEFIDKLRKRQKAKGAGAVAGAVASPGDEEKLSSRYEALPEYNPSSYVMLTVGDSSALLPGADGGDATAIPGNIRPPEHLTVTPLFGFHNFNQPAKIKAMSMHEAEQAINDQRNRMTRYMMHGRSGGAAGGIADVTGAGGQPIKIGMAKSRLLDKLASKSRANDPEVEDDDVMKDLAYRERKGGSAKARKELLTSLGDEGVTVDTDGVLGGQNDAMFGGKRRFGRLALPTTRDGVKDDDEDGKKKRKNDKDNAGEERLTSAAGNDGMAMQDDFYQRDVDAEYEELDYDANELFDDDDVDVGETEAIDDGGFAADMEDDLDEEDDEYDEEGANKGIATIAGLKALMAKKDTGEEKEEGQKPGDVDKEGRKTTAYGREDDEKDFATMPVATSDHSEDEKAGEPMDTDKTKAHLSSVEVDDDGQRVISLKAVQKEIWLNHGECFLYNMFLPWNAWLSGGCQTFAHTMCDFHHFYSSLHDNRFHHYEAITQNLQHHEEDRAREEKQFQGGGEGALFDATGQDGGQASRSQAALCEGVKTSMPMRSGGPSTREWPVIR